MFLIWGAEIEDGDVSKGAYVAKVDNFAAARLFAESRAPYDGSYEYECYIVDDGAVSWLLKPNKGGWDYYHQTGAPLVIDDDDLPLLWSSFEFEADEEALQEARMNAADGSYQAIYDAYQELVSPIRSHEGEDEFMATFGGFDSWF